MKFVSPHAALLAASQPARLGRKNTMASLMLAAARKVKAGQAAERNAWADRAGAGKTHFAACCCEFLAEGTARRDGRGFMRVLEYIIIFLA